MISPPLTLWLMGLRLDVELVSQPVSCSHGSSIGVLVLIEPPYRLPNHLIVLLVNVLGYANMFILMLLGSLDCSIASPAPETRFGSNIPLADRYIVSCES